MADTRNSGLPTTASRYAGAALDRATFLINSRGLSFDPDNDTVTTQYDGSDEPVTGSLGEVLLDPGFKIPGVQNAADLIEIAFQLGRLSALMEMKNHG